MTDVFSACDTAPGAQEVVRFLTDNDYQHVFGLPGSQLVSLYHELGATSITYVPTVHESVTVSAADGYARVKGSAFCMLYMLPGVANGLANLYNAWRDESPIIVCASQQLSTARANAAFCEGDTVSLAKPFTSLAHELTKGTPVRSWLERAKRAAEAPGGGPAFLSLTEDVLIEPGPITAERCSRRGKPGVPDVGEVAERLRAARRPLIIVGGQLRRFGGSEAIEQLAAEFDIPVAIEGGFNSQLGIAPGHSHCVGSLYMAGHHESNADVVVMLGTRSVSEASPRIEPYFRKAGFVAQVNIRECNLESTRTVDWAVAGDPGAFARELLSVLRAAPLDATLQSERRQWSVRPDIQFPPGPLGRLMNGYRRALAPLHDAMDRGWVVDESAMSGGLVIEALKSTDGRRFASCGGASLGWAIGASAGIALASEEPVTVVIGDGSVRFGAQGLWTLQALGLPVTLVVLDNHGYASTRNYERDYIRSLGEAASQRRPGYLNMDMRKQGHDVAELIRGFGLPTRRVDETEDFRAAIEEAWAASRTGPNAIILPVGFEDE